MDVKEVLFKIEFSEVMEFEFKFFFVSVGVRKSDVEGER